jgi:hypothetical protein
MMGQIPSNKNRPNAGGRQGRVMSQRANAAQEALANAGSTALGKIYHAGFGP